MLVLHCWTKKKKKLKDSIKKKVETMNQPKIQIINNNKKKYWVINITNASLGNLLALPSFFLSRYVILLIFFPNYVRFCLCNLIIFLFGLLFIYLFFFFGHILTVDRSGTKSWKSRNYSETYFTKKENITQRNIQRA